MNKIRSCTHAVALLAVVSLGVTPAPAQGSVTARLTPTTVTAGKARTVPAVLWLEPLDPALAQELSWKHPAPYRLVQKNKMFSPHVLVVPVGATVNFPNEDPFFHNVFSLFDGKRFDLGLYEAGTSKDLRFERPGISYLFCNIHPEMSAVVIALAAPLFAIAQPNGAFSIPDVPQGNYNAHLWVEGADAHALALWVHPLAVKPGASADAGTFNPGRLESDRHMNKFGKPYKPEPATY